MKALESLAETQKQQAEIARMQLEAQQQTNELLASLVSQEVPNKGLIDDLFAGVKELAEKRDFVPMGTDTSQNSQDTSQNILIEIGQKSTNTPKLDFAIQWLKQNPDDMKKSGRALENEVMMNGQKISYKWWNKAKKNVL